MDCVRPCDSARHLYYLRAVQRRRGYRNACCVGRGRLHGNLRAHGHFYIKLVPAYDLTICTDCGAGTKCAGVRQLEWCNCSAAGGPLEVNIEIADLADIPFECNPRTDGAVGLHSAWTEGWTIITRLEP
jgi:hypothetical protein